MAKDKKKNADAKKAKKVNIDWRNLYSEPTPPNTPP